MVDGMKLKRAQSVYKSMCDGLQEAKINFAKVEADLLVKFSFSGDDLSMPCIMYIDAERELIRLYSTVPMTIKASKREEVAIAASLVNYQLADGCFEFDYQTGELKFRIAASYTDSLISNEVFRYLVFVSIGTIDIHNDRFFKLVNNMLTLDNFLAKIN